MPHRGQGHRGEGVVDGGYDDEINVPSRDARLPVWLDLAAGILSGELLRLLVIRVGHGRQLNVRAQGFRTLLPDETTTDDGYAHCHF